MPKSKKKFIDKNNSVTFRLVHRSQQDPLIADETAPQRVLQPVDEKSKKENDKRIEEQHKYGIYYDDDYNYLQHLKDANPTMEWQEVERIPAAKPKPTEPKINLPSSVFASEVEEDVGMLNKAANQTGLRLDLDPDVVAAMDDDFDYSDPENQLEDDFMALANASGSDEKYEEGSEDDFSSDGEFQLSEDEEQEDNGERRIRFTGVSKSAKSLGKKSVFSEYSHTSYNPDRPELLKHLDERFEYFMENNYNDEQIGSLDQEDIEGHIDPNSDYMLKLAEEFEKEQQRENLPNQDPELKEKILKRVDELETKPEEFEYIRVKQKLPFDVESFHSNSSNIYNRPKLITITNDKKKQKEKNLEVCKEIEEDESDSESDSNSIQESLYSQISRLSMRPKNETPEERRERKRNFRNLKKEKRILKKTIKESFKDKEIQEAQMEINKANVKGKRLI